MYLFIYSGNHVSNLNVTSVSIKQHALLSAVSVPMYLLLIKWKGEHGLGRMTYAWNGFLHGVWLLPRTSSYNKICFTDRRGCGSLRIVGVVVVVWKLS